MFTGLVEGIGTVRTSAASPAGRRLELDLGPVADGVRRGDSVCISGCCQTVVDLRGSVAAFDAVPETLARTTLGGLAVGDRVNLERSLPVGGRLDGHFVQGHVDGTARLIERREQGAERLWVFACDPSLTDQMTPKGSVAIDGVSLTLVDVADGRFSVALIPTTLAATTLGSLTVGRSVNIETDILGKYVFRALRRGSSGLTLDKLRDAGFLD